MTIDQRPNVVNFGAGVCFVALGILLLLEKSDVVQMQQIVRLWPVALIVMGGAVAWQASRGGQGASASAGWLVWILILGLIFNHTLNRRAEADRARAEGEVEVFAVMSGDRRPVLNGPFTGGRLTTVMGGAKLDLRQASLAPGATAELDVFTMMGGAEIQVPPDWQVDIRTTSIAGGVNDERGQRPREDDDAEDIPLSATAAEPSSPASSPGVPSRAPKLVLKGFIMFGGINIKSS